MPRALGALGPTKSNLEMERMRRMAPILFVLLSAALGAAPQKGGHRSPRTRSSSSSTPSSSSNSKSKRLPSSHKTATSKSTVSPRSTVAARNSHGRIKRSASARNAFKKQTGYPHGWKGYVVDHVVPLECGGADAPSNMQWQTVAEAKVKDRTERNCRRE